MSKTFNLTQIKNSTNYGSNHRKILLGAGMVFVCSSLCMISCLYNNLWAIFVSTLVVIVSVYYNRGGFKLFWYEYLVVVFSGIGLNEFYEYLKIFVNFSKIIYNNSKEIKSIRKEIKSIRKENKSIRKENKSIRKENKFLQNKFKLAGIYNNGVLSSQEKEILDCLEKEEIEESALSGNFGVGEKLTFVFVDIVQSTRMIEKSVKIGKQRDQVNDFVEFKNEIFINSIKKNGYVCGNGGDGCFLVFKTPQKVDVEKVIDFIIERYPKLAKNYHFSIRVGVNTGTSYVKYDQFALFRTNYTGKDVNLASRLEEALKDVVTFKNGYIATSVKLNGKNTKVKWTTKSKTLKGFSEKFTFYYFPFNEPLVDVIEENLKDKY